MLRVIRIEQNGLMLAYFLKFIFENNLISQLVCEDYIEGNKKDMIENIYNFMYLLTDGYDPKEQNISIKSKIFV